MIFILKEKDINQITSVKVIAMFGFTGNNPLQDANLNDEKVLSQIFTLNQIVNGKIEGENIKIKPSITALGGNKYKFELTMNKSKLNKNYRLTFIYNDYNDKSSLDFSVFDSSPIINITSHLSDGWYIQKDRSFPEAKLNISNDSVVYGINFENYNILGKSVNNSVEPHFLLDKEGESVILKSGETSFIKDISALYAKKTKNDNFNTNLVKLISELDTNTDNAEENNRRSTESEKNID